MFQRLQEVAAPLLPPVTSTILSFISIMERIGKWGIDDDQSGTWSRPGILEETMLPALQDPSFSEARATRLILDQIADKWSIMILVFLCEKQAQRFSAIKRRLGGITQKSLTQALRRLERNGLLTRRVIAASPIAVA